MPEPIASSRARCCAIPSRINLERKAAPAVGITQAVYPVPQDLKAALLLTLLERGEMQDALVFTRTKHRADRLAKYLAQARASRRRASTATARSRQRTEALAGFKDGKYRVLVATDIAARGIDVEALGHVVNFDVPHGARRLHPPRRPHGARRGDGRRLHLRRAGGGDDLARIERAIGKRLPRVTVPDFDYAARTEKTELGRSASPAARGGARGRRVRPSAGASAGRGGSSGGSGARRRRSGGGARRRP